MKANYPLALRVGLYTALSVGSIQVKAGEAALKALDRGTAMPMVASSKTYVEEITGEKRIFEDYILSSGAGETHITISKPEKVPPEGLPCVFIIAGLETGRQSLKLIPNHGKYILISYEYPPVIKQLKSKSAAFYIISARSACLNVPAQVTSTVRWLSKQDFCSGEPTSMMGYSFGSVFLPSILNLGQSNGLTFGPTVFGYGGAGLYCLFKALLPGPKWFKKMGARFSTWIFKPLEPSLHLPYVTGRFLVLNGTEDTQIPVGCALCLQKLVPEPKTVINLETPHLMPDNPELLAQVVEISRSWMEKNRAQ